MKYMTTNEWEHFGFSQAYLCELAQIGDCFQLTLDNVKIAPENSKNRDIREMRTNGSLINEYEDREITQECWNDKLKSFTDGECCLYALEKTEDIYTFMIDASDEHTYILRIKGIRDIQEWDRFLQL